MRMNRLGGAPLGQGDKGTGCLVQWGVPGSMEEQRQVVNTYRYKMILYIYIYQYILAVWRPVGLSYLLMFLYAV